ncbi:MAG TPA: J domain-containing protein [Polyangia bacterium]|jgi:DnaJ-domain-containing protein 1|nr:J domain-containing protein [Polyangia bacterium]
MSIGKRLIDLARSELNSLLDKAAEVDEPEDQFGDRWSGELGNISDGELQAELERRRQAREEAEEAARGPRPASAKPDQTSARSSSGARAEPPRRTAAGDQALRKAYAALEVSPGSDFETVRKAYRRLMRKYHPDLHGGSPEALRAATDLTQRLTEAYKLIEKRSR